MTSLGNFIGFVMSALAMGILAYFINQAYQHGYIDNEEFTQAIRELNDVIRDTGEWA